MTFAIKRIKTHLLIGSGLLLVPLLTFSQGQDFPVNQKGQWERLMDDKIGINNSAIAGEPQRTTAASGPNSIVAQRSMSIDTNNNGTTDGRLYTVLESTDQGESWNPIFQKNKDKADIRGHGIAHPKAEIIGMLTLEKKVTELLPSFSYSTDGGENFRKVQHESEGGIVKGDEAINISMYDEKHWAFTTHDEFSLKDHTYLYITHDGGKTWEEKHIKVPSRDLGVYQVVMRSPRKISLFPRHIGNAKTRISTDGGKTWETYSQMPNKAIGWRNSIEFPTPDTGYVGGQFTRGRDGADTGKIFKTTDGGRSWDLILNTLLPVPINGIFEIDFISKKEGLVSGKWAENTLRTTDGGETWMRDSVVYDKPQSDWEIIYTEKDGKKLALALLKNRGSVFRFKVTDTSANTSGKEQVNDQEQGLSIYPNPSDGAFRIRWHGQEAVAGTLYNMQGQAVRSFQLAPQQEATYTLSGIQAGTYIFKVNGRDIAKKVLIKQN